MASTTEAIRAWCRRLAGTRGQVHTRFNDEELAVLDRLVSDGVGTNRGSVIRQAVCWYDDALQRRSL